jgi:hypothetical protein
MTKKTKREEPTPETVDDLIADLLQRYEVPASRYSWPEEDARWEELVFCLLAHIGAPDVPPEAARSASNVLAELGLLQIDELAALATSSRPADSSHRILDIIRAVLQRKGYAQGQDERGLVALCELASSFVHQHDGKVQRYLRLYGQRMLDELGDHVRAGPLSDADIRYIFTHWLQNVLNMPICLSTSAVQEFCAANNVSLGELVDAADRQDLNLALLDDLVAEYVREPEPLELDSA